MEVIDVERPPEKPIAFVITGEGRLEKRVLDPLSHKYDGEKFLFFPAKPSPEKVTGQQILKVLFNPTRPLIKKIDAENFLILIDKEQNISTTKLRKDLGKLHFNLDDILYEEEGLFIGQGRFGDKFARLFIIMSGINWCLEEEVAEIIRLKYGVLLEAENRQEMKNKVRNFRKSRNRNIEDIIQESGRAKLEEAFPGLTKVLQHLKQRE